MRRLAVLCFTLAACTTDQTGGEPIHGAPDAHPGPGTADGSMPVVDAAPGTPDAHAAADAHPTSDGAPGPDGPTGGVRTVFVIPMENEPSSAIYGNNMYAPYINGLLSQAAHTTMFQDELPALVSEPHYIWMEAGTNAFTGHTFTADSEPSSTNSTKSTAHLVTQLGAAHIAWTSYQQGITSGTCPVASAGVYATKHDPFVFFQDVAGNPPNGTATLCATHHKAFTDFAGDLAAGNLSGYVFITGDLCHDMHGDSQCTQGTSVNGNIAAGDAWLSSFVPSLITYAQTHDALIFITWDEGDSSNLIPFLALGKNVKPGPDGTTYSHSSMLKSVEEYLGVPVLSTVSSANDFSAMFQPGTFP